jgi:hypothetical protein
MADPELTVISQSPPKLVRKRVFKNDREKLMYSLNLFRKLSSTPVKIVQEPPVGLLSRPDVSLKV